MSRVRPIRRNDNDHQPIGVVGVRIDSERTSWIGEISVDDGQLRIFFWNGNAWVLTHGARRWDFDRGGLQRGSSWPEEMNAAEEAEMHAAFRDDPGLRSSVASFRKRTLERAFSPDWNESRLSAAAPPTQRDARAAYDLIARARCADIRTKRRGSKTANILAAGRARESRRIATLAEMTACPGNIDDPIVSTTACDDLYTSLESTPRDPCKIGGPSVPCNHRVTTAMARAYKTGEGFLPPMGPYETTVPHGAGGTAACYYHTVTQTRIALQHAVAVDVHGHNPHATDADVYAAIRDAEDGHQLGETWAALDARARASFGIKIARHRDVFESDIDRLKELRDMIRAGEEPPSSMLRMAGINDQSSNVVQDIEEAYALAMRDRDSARGRGRVSKKRAVGMHRHRSE